MGTHHETVSDASGRLASGAYSAILDRRDGQGGGRLYYPCCQVYCDTGRRAWFYIKTGQWTVGASIPTELKAQLGPYVNISLDTDRPYDHFDEHRQDYPAEKYKKQKK
jgi:hypothetical protein